MNNKDTSIKRMYLLLTGVFLFGSLIIFKLYTVQIVNGQSWTNKADKQHTLSKGDVLERGLIYFSTKDGRQLDAATIRSGFLLAIVPKQIENPEELYNKLITVLPDLDKETVVFRASKEDDPYEELARKIPEEQAQKIRELEIPGVYLYKDSWRFYPGNSLASQVLGFMSWSEDIYKGQYGLERFYDKTLTYTSEVLYANFFVELFKDISGSSDKEGEQGSLVATIEPTVQATLEQEIKSINDYYNSTETGGIIMNPHTGEIIAMAQYPSFDLNQFNTVEDVSLYGNTNVERVFEMGSIMKPISVAIGLDTGVITADSTYDDKGEMTLDTETFYNYDKVARGVVDMQTVLNKSLNTGVATIFQRVGHDRFADYMKKIFSNQTKVDLPNEASPLADNLNSPRDIELATASFGQGVAVSPISMIRGLASLANGGYLVKPHVIKEIKYRSGSSEKINYENDKERVFSEETSKEISRMLKIVVDEALKDGTVSLPNHSVAAKTGTAQIADSSGGYYSDRYMHTFFGFLTSEDPRFIVLLYTREPKGVQYASETLTDPFMNLARFLITYYEIPPDR